ncbi:MAG TPA: permease-like cell division protein FtsX [Candidatus Nitrosotenuis sp.]|nr:permease-like cell division protein FtsX [Candidatus Nitrosotenuis sp.]
MSARYFLREVLLNVRRSPLMSIASVSTVMVLAVILGLFAILAANLQFLTDSLASELKVVAFMREGFGRGQAQEVQRRLGSLPHVRRAHFVSKETAFKRLKERLGGRISLEDVGTNPLPDSFEIEVDRPDNLKAVAARVREVPGVARVKVPEDLVRRMLAFNQMVRWVGMAILTLLFVSTILIVSNTIRLTVFARRKEIEIMQMVGAAGWFIRWPFILEGVVQGLAGAGLAALLVDLSYRLLVPGLARTVPFLPLVAPDAILPQLGSGLLLLGALVGAMGSLISVNRYLKV